MTQTDKCTMFLNFKHQYCENDYLTQSSPQIQCKPYQITNGIFFSQNCNKKFYDFSGNTKTWIAKAIFIRKNWTVGIRLSDFRQYILHSCSYQESMLLVLKQKYRSIIYDRKARDKPMHLWSPNLWQRRQK